MSKFQCFLQFDSSDCGLTALRMISNYYGKELSLKTLKSLIPISKDGVSLLSISEAAEKIGFKTLGGKLNYDKLVREANLPCIIHWNQNHFVVLYKIKKKILTKRIKLFVADPGLGSVIYNENEFKQSWISTKSNSQEKGIVLLFEPTIEFKKEKIIRSKYDSLDFLFLYFKQYKKFFLQLILGLLLGSLFQLVFPLLTQAIIDNGIHTKNIKIIYLILLGQVFLIISKASVDFIRHWILLHISTRINISLISDFLIKLMKMPMSYFDSKHIGDILQRIDDHERVERFITTRTLDTLFSLFTLIVFGIILFLYNIKIFTIFTLGSLLYVGWIFLFLKKRRVLDYKTFKTRAKEQGKTFQLVQGMQEIKLQNVEKRKRWEWEDIQADLFVLNTNALRLDQQQHAGNILINEIKNILITILAAIAVINNEMTLGMMLATQYIIGQLTLPVEQLAKLIHDYQDTKISIERINEIHKQKEEDDNLKDVHTFIANNTITLNNLTFQYEGINSPKVLNKINLTIPYGKVTAIVGSSGSGKTTLIKLLLKYYNPSEGQIIIGDQNLNKINSKWWRNICGVVMQDGFIFSDSIADNIAVSTDEIDNERLLDAAKNANIHDDIMLLPLKYNTIIGTEGQNISQGQKQRILIARAIYKNPDFLFLDEATNSLDANNEKIINDKLQKFYHGKTVVVIAHRLSTVKNADQIVVLEKGEIVELGTHDDLSNAKGSYYQLVKNQLELGE